MDIIEREDLNFNLQHVLPNRLREECNAIEREAEIEMVQKPTRQTMLIPVEDPINQGTFLAGEKLVTSAVVKVNGEPGWAMIADQNDELARMIAILDAAFASGVRKDQITHLALEGRKIKTENQAAVNQQINATRVSFDLL